MAAMGKKRNKQTTSKGDTAKMPAKTAVAAAAAAAPATPPAPQRSSILRIVAEMALIALGVVSIAYGIAVYLLGTGSWFFLFWFVLGAGLVFWAVALMMRWTEKVAAWAKIAFAAVLVAVVAMCGTAYAAIMEHADDRPPAGVDYLIVLGAQVTEGGPSAVLRLRLYAAIDYLTANPDTICIVTGCQGPSEPWPEAWGMRDFLVANGIPIERIIVEDRARDTAENIAFSSEFIPEGATIALVSNNFHIFRALMIAKKQGLDGVYGLATQMAPFYFPNNATREMFAIIFYRLLGKM